MALVFYGKQLIAQIFTNIISSEMDLFFCVICQITATSYDQVGYMLTRFLNTLHVEEDKFLP
jgi:hypothetical protein